MVSENGIQRASDLDLSRRALRASRALDPDGLGDPDPSSAAGANGIQRAKPFEIKKSLFSAEPRKGYAVIGFLVVMTMVIGIVSTSITLLWHQRDMQLLRIDRLRAEALVRSAWTWREMNPDAAVHELPLPFSPEQLRGNTAIPALIIPIDGTVYLVESGGTLWAVGIYGEVLEWGVRGL